MEAEGRSVGVPPLGMEACMVISGVVGDDDHPAAGPGADSAKMAQKLPAGLGVEASLGLGGAQFAVPKADGAKIADALAGWGMNTDRIANFRGNPHPTAAAMLLEVNLIHRPEIHARVAGESTKFFCVRPAKAGRLGRSEDEACEVGIPTGGTGVGTALPARSPRAPSPDRRTATVRPRDVRAGQSPTDCASAPLPPSVAALRSDAKGALRALRRSSPRIRSPRILEPSRPSSAANPPGLALPCGSSSPEPQATPHATGGRTGRRGCGVSRPATRRSSPRGSKWSVPSWASILEDSFTMRNNLRRCI